MFLEPPPANRRPSAAAVVPIALAAVLAAEPSVRAQEAAGGSPRERRIEERLVWSEGQAVAIDFPVGRLEVRAGEVREAHLIVLARCRFAEVRCAGSLDDIAVQAHAGRGRLEMQVRGEPKWSHGRIEVEATLAVPRGAAIEVDMGVGELAVSGLENDVWADLGVGEIQVELPVKAVRSVDVDAGVGEAELRLPDALVEGRRSILVGSEVRWSDGPGAARVHVEVGVGEATVRLD